MGFNPSLTNAASLGGTTPTAAGLAILDDANAAAQRVTLGVVANTVFETVAAGTAYTLTGTPAAVDFGTTDPAIVITTAGTYLVKYRLLVKLSAATFAAAKIVTAKLRRTNNTPADVANSSKTLTVGIITTLTQTLGEITGETVYTTANADDAIALFASLETLPGAGTVDITEASILAVRVG